ncbi:MAG TPA: hypothetical protein PK723_05885, partial [Candidatus Pacearchaeota archaeon]|nr:hypothetical protein [Candidatus Pacearchaeota archaeon]
GLWLDWQAQGTRVSKNLFYQNTRDLYVEVSHGPYVIDHNILASEYSIDNMAQGGAYINNLICGKVNQQKVLNRSTPYHFPHSTKVAGYACVYGGDDRFYNNIFIGETEIENVGTSHYANYTTSLDEYIKKVHEKHGDLETFELVEQPVYIDNNAYFNGAEPFEKENCKLVEEDFDPKFKIIDNGEEVYLSCSLPDTFEKIQGKIHSTSTLERVRIVDAEFDCPNGKDLILDTDFFDKPKTEKHPLGPIMSLRKGKNYIKVW